jgi:glycosyltransferase involved in cell wall biosynthesis
MAGINVHIYPSPFRNESRILKITEFLERAEMFEHIYVIATAAEDLPASESISPGRTVLRLARRSGVEGAGMLGKVAGTLRWSLRVWSAATRLSLACINCHSLPVLPLCVALKLRTGAKLVYDIHELETETANSTGLRRILAKVMERLLIRFADEVVVVNDYIRDWYVRAYGLKRAWTVKNVPRRTIEPPPRSRTLRNEFGIPDGALLLIYQGVLARGRGVETMLRVFERAAPEQHLVLMGFGPLTEMVLDHAACCPNIHYRRAVAPQDVPTYTAGADVGLCLIENVCLSYFHCLPNKLFEYANCGVPVIVSDFPEMSEFVERHGCGWCIDPDERSLARTLAALSSEEIMVRRERALAARPLFGWELEEPTLRDIYGGLGFTVVPNEKRDL